MSDHNYAMLDTVPYNVSDERAAMYLNFLDAQGFKCATPGCDGLDQRDGRLLFPDWAELQAHAHYCDDCDPDHKRRDAEYEKLKKLQ